MARWKKAAEPKPPPILKVQTSGEMEDVERIIDLLNQARRIAATGPEGAVARKRQVLNSLINPHATLYGYEDHNGQRKTVHTFSSAIAAERLASVKDLRAQAMTRQEVGDLIGLSPTGIQAIEERGEGRRAKQRRVSLADAERLKQAKAADLAVVLPVVDEPIPTA